MLETIAMVESLVGMRVVVVPFWQVGTERPMKIMKCLFLSIRSNSICIFFHLFLSFV